MTLKIYYREMGDVIDPNTRTTSIDMAKVWKARGFVVRPDPDELARPEPKFPPLPLALDISPARMSIQIKAGELVELIRRWGREVYAAAQQAAPETPYRVAEFWSSANPGKKVRMLAEGSDVVEWAKRSDFVRWVDASVAAPEAKPVARVTKQPGCFDLESLIADDKWPEGVTDLYASPVAAEHITVIANLASVVRAQNGNRYADINELLARAEKCVTTPTAPQAASQQAGAPVAWIATDLDGRAGVGFTKEAAKREAGEGCTEFIPLFDLGAASQAATTASPEILVVNGDGIELAIERRTDGKWQFCPTSFNGERPFLNPAATSASQHAEQKCTCVYATSENTDSVRKGFEMGGYLKHECEACKAAPQAATPASEPDIFDAVRDYRDRHPEVAPQAPYRDVLEMIANTGMDARQCMDAAQRALDSTPAAPDAPLSNAEFLAKRLGRVAKLAGVTMPGGTYEQIAEVAGTILGEIARALETRVTLPTITLASDADAESCARRLKNFSVRAEPAREPDFVGEKSILVTYNGRQEYTTALAPHEARKFYDLLAIEYGFAAQSTNTENTDAR